MKKISRFRIAYIRRLIIRIMIFLITICIYIFNKEAFEVAKNFNFIKSFSPLHILWLIWVIDMILQLCRVPKYWPLGSQKYFKSRYIPDLVAEIDKKIIKKYMKKLNKESIIVAIIWVLFVGIIDTLYLINIIPYEIIILISTFFYVCDLICVVIWCPFKKFIMHNKCCTTCRIFNWDHAMMFLPLIVIPGLWTYSLILLSFVVLTVWEVACTMYPERFLEKTNCALRCQYCNDRLCGKER